ncbi:unnamed protein product [Phytophthora lilii]|uniref:Unnamed protein product n=1 Tax=Phytophthora lilii TaxID=2077276 RepID=A0A9W6TRV3_9STRA|nr:unnamed protein product [Phytophthora lilii]
MDERALASQDGGVVALDKQQSGADMTWQPATAISSTSIIVIALGFVVLTGLVIFMCALRRGGQDQSDSDAASNLPPENSRRCMKRMTFAVPERRRTGLDDIDSSGSVVPVLGDDASYRKMRGGSRLETNSWAEVSAATTSNSVAPLSSRHSRPAMPTLIYMPARGRCFNDTIAPSDCSSHTDDYSIDILESPESTEYSFGSEGDDMFPSTPWDDDVDSYRSMDYTFLSTSSSDVFGSNRARNAGAWKQVYGPNTDPPQDSDLPRLSSGVLFVRQMNARDMRRIRLDTRANGAKNNSLMRFDVEV